jgi:hypothetical protein
LRKTGREACKDFIVNLLLIVLPLPFFALAGAVIHFDGKIPDQTAEDWFKQTTWVAATLFPLIFALVLGNLSVKLSSFNLERGTNLEFLERLMGSRSFFGTIRTQLRIWPWNLLAICLVFVWLLSPFGSQAILRCLSIDLLESEDGNVNITYFNTRQGSFAADTSTLDKWLSGFSTLLSASLLASEGVKIGVVDSWGNIIIPRLSSLSNGSSPDSDGWFDYPTGFIPTPSSLFGVPISPPPNRTTEFSLESSYLELSCTNITTNVTRETTTSGPVFINPNMISPTGPFISSQTITNTTVWALGYVGHDITSLLPSSQNETFSLDAIPANSTDNFFPGLVIYQDFTGLMNVTNIYCAVSQAYTESTISCSGTRNPECKVTKQRPSLLPHAPSTLSLLNFREILLALTSLLPTITSTSNNVSILQNYLFNPTDNAFIQTAQSPSTVGEESRFLHLSLQDFGKRLGAVLNSFLHGTQANSSLYLTGTQLPFQAPGNLDAAIMATAPSLTTAASSSTTFLFHVSRPWIAIYLLACTVMLIAAIAATILQHLTLSRDYLGFVSSTVRESVYSDMPRGGVRLDGLGRTRKLRDMRVWLGDVGNENGMQIGIGAALSVGRLGIGGRGTRRLDKRKLYT